MRKFGLVMLVPMAMFAQELVGTFTVDTNVYENISSCEVIRGPEYEFRNLAFIHSIWSQQIELLACFRKKGTDQYDIFSYTGRIGSTIIPSSITQPEYRILGMMFSQTFIDSDTGFECIVIYVNTTNEKSLFNVIDESGDVLLSDSGSATYGNDGKNTYVVRCFDSYSYKVWKFRSNIAPASHPLSKTTASPGPMMAYLPSGDLRVSLQPVSIGTSIQIFDMLGRQIFQKSIQNIRERTSFIIPSTSMPNSPFVAKVNNNNGTFVKKEIPIR
jgi:hypothetical protein